LYAIEWYYGDDDISEGKSMPPLLTRVQDCVSDEGSEMSDDDSIPSLVPTRRRALTNVLDSNLDDMIWKTSWMKKQISESRKSERMTVEAFKC
jgi:hypothetical protein